MKKMTLLSTRLKERKGPKMDMAPMIDCVFLLLIFFMVATTFAPMPGIRVQLPPPGRPQPEDKPKGLIVRISNPEAGKLEGVMILNNDLVDFNQMFTRYINAADEAKNMLIIQSERKVMHEQVIRVMDIAKRAGIDKIGFAVVARQ
jgi:biopolymer transport protein ExbD